VCCSAIRRGDPAKKRGVDTADVTVPDAVGLCNGRRWLAAQQTERPGQYHGQPGKLGGNSAKLVTGPAAVAANMIFYIAKQHVSQPIWFADLTASL